MENIKKFDTANAADQYAIKDIPFITSIATVPIQNLTCNESGKKLVNTGGLISVQNAGPEMVDLGLPSGTLWAKCNLGAQLETDYGDYYQWAATTPLHVEGTTVNPAADFSLCPYCTDPIGGSTFSKYNGTDGLTTLQTSDDAVASQFAGYRIPTKADFEELISETNKEWTTINGINGYKFTNKSDSSKYIFLPAAGGCDDSNLKFVGNRGMYSSSSLSEDNPYATWDLYFNNGGINIVGNYRYFGISVRPVQHVSNS